MSPRTRGRPPGIQWRSVQNHRDPWNRHRRRRQRVKDLATVLLTLLGLALAALATMYLESPRIHVPIDPPGRSPRTPRIQPGELTMPARVQSQPGEESSFAVIVEPADTMAAPSRQRPGERRYKTKVAESAILAVQAIDKDDLEVELLTSAKQPVIGGDGKAQWNVRYKAHKPGTRTILVDYQIIFSDDTVYDLESGRAVEVTTHWTFAYIFAAMAEKASAIAAVLGSAVAIAAALGAIFSPRVRAWFAKGYRKVLGKSEPVPASAGASKKRSKSRKKAKQPAP